MTMSVAVLNALRTRWQRLDASRQLARTRQQLSRMPDRLLADIGLSPELVACGASALQACDPSPASGLPRAPRGPALPLGFAALARLSAAIFPNRA